MTQKQLAAAIGVSRQQIQKYENGKSRVTCDRLSQIALALGVPESYFFPNRDGDASDALLAMIDRPDVIKMLHAFQMVDGMQKRSTLISFIETYARTLTMRDVDR